MRQTLREMTRLPSTRGGRFRLLGLIALNIVSVAFPGLPQGVAAAIKLVSGIISGQ